MANVMVLRSKIAVCSSVFPQENDDPPSARMNIGSEATLFIPLGECEMEFARIDSKLSTLRKPCKRSVTASLANSDLLKTS